MKRAFLLTFLIFGLINAHAAKIQLRSSTTQNSEITVQQGDELDLEIFVDVGQMPTSAVELYLDFDPNALRISDPKSPFDDGDFMVGNVIANRLIDSRTIAFAIALNNRPFPTGSGTLAKIKFIANRAGNTEIRLKAEAIDWVKGQYTFFTTIDNDQSKARSFKEVVSAKIGIKNTLITIDKLELQRYVYEKPGTNINLDDFVKIVGSEGKPQLNWIVEGEDQFGRPVDVEINAANQLIIRSVLPKTRDEKIQISLRVALKIGESLAVDSTTISIVNQDVPQIQALPEMRFRFGEEGIILLDNYVTDRNNNNAELRWTIEQIPAELKVEGVSLDRADRSKGIVNEPPRLAFRSPNPINSEQQFDLVLTVTDPDGNYDTANLKVVVLPLPFVSIDLQMPSELTLLKNEEHKIELERYVDIEPKEALGQILWEVTPSEHIEAQIKNFVVIIRPQRDWTGSAEKVIVTAKFEGKKIDESVIMVSVFDLPNESTDKAYPVMLIRNPIAKNEFKIVVSLADVAEITAAIIVPDSPDIGPQTINLRKVENSRAIWFGRYALPTPPRKGDKIVISIVGKNTLNQNIPSSTTAIEF